MLFIFNIIIDFLFLGSVKNSMKLLHVFSNLLSSLKTRKLSKISKISKWYPSLAPIPTSATYISTTYDKMSLIVSIGNSIIVLMGLTVSST